MSSQLVFHNPGFKDDVREYLNIPHGPISSEDIAKITELDAYNYDVADEDIETLTQGRTVYNTEKIGRSKGATVALKDGETDFNVQGLDVSVQPMNLQQIFVAMCGKEAEI